MLHYTVVAVGVDLDVAVRGVCKTPIHNSLEDAVGGGGATDAVDDVVGNGVVKPFSAVDLCVGGFGGRDEGEVGDDIVAFACFGFFVYYNVPVAVLDIVLDDFFAGIAVYPLTGVAVGAHNLPGIVEDGHYLLEVWELGFTDSHRSAIIRNSAENVLYLRYEAFIVFHYSRIVGRGV